MAMIADRRADEHASASATARSRCRNHCGRHCHCRWWLAARQLGRDNGGDGWDHWDGMVLVLLKTDARLHKRNAGAPGTESKQSAPGVGRLAC